MFYRNALLACCILAAILMVAIFYNAISSLIERNISQLDAIYALNGSLLGAALFTLLGLTEPEKTATSITDPYQTL
jgi:hypothetical protein